jgi:hypothetical protein
MDDNKRPFFQLEINANSVRGQASGCVKKCHGCSSTRSPAISQRGVLSCR